MSITAIGSTFSHIRPEAVGRTPQASPASGDTTSALKSSEATSAGPQAIGRSGGSVADQLRALMVGNQETNAMPPSPREATRAYGGG